ncbi:MAG TPA: alpha/beta fold hydrolase [Candidatus Binatia bacterium]|nr:alpha/beta fold hydrolase [Candidatus Binatia bacterium]
MPLLRHRAGSGEPLVLIHGVASSWRDWKPVLPALERRFDVVALALPGHYEAPDFAPRVPATVDGLIAAVATELDRLALARPHLAGNSLGGWIALELAARGRAVTVSALAPAGLATAEEARAMERAVLRNHRLARVVSALSPIVAHSRLVARMVLAGSVRDASRIDPRETAYKLNAFARCPRFRELLRDLCARRVEHLADVRCPALVVWGDEDRRLPVAHAERFARAIPHARVAILPGAGHLPMWDDPAAVAELIADFALPEPARAQAVAR